MADVPATSLTIAVGDSETVSGLLILPRRPKACYVLAHGAGAGMAHPFMTAIAEGLHDRAIATFRYQFPYMQKGSNRPDPPPLAQATVRVAVAQAARQLPSVPLFAGGKSFGGRMTSQAQATSPLPAVLGLAFLGFPLHPAGKPSVARAQHLSDIDIPMLFMQGARDTLADAALIRQVVKQLGTRAALAMFPDADHSFHVPVRSGRTDQQVMAQLLDELAQWFESLSPHVR